MLNAINDPSDQAEAFEAFDDASVDGLSNLAISTVGKHGDPLPASRLSGPRSSAAGLSENPYLSHLPPLSEISRPSPTATCTKVIEIHANAETAIDNQQYLMTGSGQMARAERNRRKRERRQKREGIMATDSEVARQPMTQPMWDLDQFRPSTAEELKNDPYLNFLNSFELHSAKEREEDEIALKEQLAINEVNTQIGLYTILGPSNFSWVHPRYLKK